jgi:protein-arginine kinase activator protein McsA|tara:strand:+ start:1330 stop:1563 length:234 start_codon:yes stop_codon:yes gene_type:complete
MYINGRKITLDELEVLTNNLISSLIDDLYKSILDDGIEMHVPGVKKKQRSILNKMIEHYVEREEYEKCATLRDMINF